MITFLPQRGTMVSKLNLTRIENERFIRKAIEGKVLEDFIGLFLPAVILRLENNILEQKEYYRTQDVRGFLRRMKNSMIFFSGNEAGTLLRGDCEEVQQL